MAASGTGKSTRYWDCCKPSCAWAGKASVNQPVLTCDKNDSPLDPGAKSGCESGGSAYTCTGQAPWAVNGLVSFGFAATAINGGTEASWCCGCYAITFTSGKNKGKIMVVQSTNTGGDLGSNHFDIMIPGGGLGIFDGCTSEFGFQFPGARYGGVSSRSECSALPAKLQSGCQWRFDWFMNADNPDLSFTQVQCPAELVTRSGCRRSDDASFPAFQMPTNTKWEPPQSTEVAGPNEQCDSTTWDAQKKSHGIIFIIKSRSIFHNKHEHQLAIIDDVGFSTNHDNHLHILNLGCINNSHPSGRNGACLGSV
ncbi:putative endonuclease LCL3 [Colletotrichum spaethianum]|uniref:Cellulase n=1 Tax=Colletotrichum spaethianum TaxID=700344 RepID=A0AA37PEM3_9PEZI|nr:putative endonuclease LCL3 [Colletotrichum spaethianum]GKT50886.1 putative endonuclease LCL3 [Colletotrichum spaethianum]